MRYILLFLIYFNLYAVEFESIHYTGPSENRLDLVFIGDRYFSDEMGEYEKDVNVIWQHLQKNYAFWDRYKNFFNIHRIDLVSELKNPDDIKDANNSAFGLDFNLGYWDGWNDWQKCLRLAEQAGIGNEVTCILTNRVYGLGTALDRSSTGLIYAAPWPSIIAHEIGHIMGMAGDEYRTTIQEYMYDYAFNMARSANEARKRWGHWIGYTDPFTGYQINEPYQKEGTNFFRPSKSNGLMNESATGDFHAVNREQMILQLYKNVNVIDSHTETNSSVNQDRILEINVVDPDVISIAWIVNDEIVSNQSTLRLSELKLNEDSIIYGCAWDNSLNLDYQANDRGGWIRKNENNTSHAIISWLYSADKKTIEHSQGQNKDYLPLLLKNTENKTFFNQNHVENLSIQNSNKESTQNPDRGEYFIEDKIHCMGWIKDWFGDYLSFSNFWVYHIKYKWVYKHDTYGGGAWLWFPDEEAWFWSNAEFCPYFYDHKNKKWIYFN